MCSPRLWVAVGRRRDPLARHDRNGESELDAVRRTSPACAVMITSLGVATRLVAISNVLLVAPPGIVSDDGTVTAGLSAASVTANPSRGAAPLRGTVPRP